MGGRERGKGGKEGVRERGMRGMKEREGGEGGREGERQGERREEQKGGDPNINILKAHSLSVYGPFISHPMP